VEDNCRGVLAVLLKGRSGEVYNVASDEETTNLELTKRILAEVGKPESLIKYVKDRPGHDRRYSTDSRKLRGELGWAPAYDFAEGLAETVQWYMEHREWWEHIRSGAYQAYYEKQYGGR